MKTSFLVSFFAVAGLCTSAAYGQGSIDSITTSNNNQMGYIGSPFSSSSGSNNIIQPSGATNRPFQNNSTSNGLNNTNGFSSLNNQNGAFFIQNSHTNLNNNSANPFQLTNSNEPLDEDITDEVRRGLMGPGFSPGARASSVTTSGGTVTLNGTVSSQAEKNRLEAAARSTSGVKTIVNHLTIRQSQ